MFVATRMFFVLDLSYHFLLNLCILSLYALQRVQPEKVSPLVTFAINVERT